MSSLILENEEIRRVSSDLGQWDKYKENKPKSSQKGIQSE